MRLSEVADAYSATGPLWDAGPGRIYDRLAGALVDASPISLSGCLVADVGAGTGAASRAIARLGARPVAVDVAAGMLAAGRTRAGPSAAPAAVADACRLPFRRSSLDAVVAAFSYNHVSDPVGALAEARRVVTSRGALLVASYAEADRHPVKDVVRDVAAEVGWSAAAWAQELPQLTVPLADVDRATAAVRAAGLVDERAEVVEIAFPELDAADLVRWRLGMAQLAPFVARLDTPARQRLVERAVARLDPCPPLVRHVLLLTARVP